MRAVDAIMECLKAEGVDAGAVAVRIGRPQLVAVQHDKSAFGQRPELFVGKRHTVYRQRVNLGFHGVL